MICVKCGEERINNKENKCRRCKNLAQARYNSTPSGRLVKKSYRNRHPEIMREAAKRYMDRNLTRVIEFKGNKCENCQQSFPRDCYKFKQGLDKEFYISAGLRTKGIKSLLREVSKAEMFCLNCFKMLKRKKLGEKFLN